MTGTLLSGGPSGPAAVLLNLSGAPVTVTLPADLAAGLPTRTLSAPPATYVVDSRTVRPVTGVSSARITLPPLSLTRVGR